MSLPWEVVGTIHGNSKYVGTKNVHCESRMLENKFKFGIDIVEGKPN
jgi:hypothetical protein